MKFDFFLDQLITWGFAIGAVCLLIGFDTSGRVSSVLADRGGIYMLIGANLICGALCIRFLSLAIASIKEYRDGNYDSGTVWSEGRF
jgi:hypothetical protein